MTLRRQILAGFAVLLFPLAIVAGLALATIYQLGGAVDAVLLENERTLHAVAEMEGALERLDSAALLVLLGRRDEAGGIAAAGRSDFRAALEDAAGNVTVEGEDEVVRGVQAAYEGYDRSFDALFAADEGGARTAYSEELVPAFERTRGGLEALRGMNREDARVSGQEAGAVARSAMWAVGAGAALALALGVWAAAKLSREIAGQYGRTVGAE